MQFMC